MKLSTLLARLAEGTASADEQLAASVWIQRAYEFAQDAEALLANFDGNDSPSYYLAEASSLHIEADELASDYVEMDEGDRAPFFGSEGGAA